MISERAKKNLTAINKAMSSCGQACVARAMGVNEGTVSKMKDTSQGEIKITFESLAKGLAEMNLKCVPVEMKCYDSATIDSMFNLAKQRMDQLHTSDQLIWDD